MAAIRIERHGDIAEVILARAEKHNAISVDTLTELMAAGRELARDKSLRAVIIHGEGPSFCSGLNIPSFMAKPHNMARHFLRPLWRNTNNFQEVAWVWRRLAIPVIAVLHGRCYGAGMQIALAADFRLATPNCELSIMEAKWGLVPDMSGTVSLRELVPMDIAKRLSMTAEVFSAEQGMAWGLVTETHADPLMAARELAARIATRSPDAVASTKFLFQRAWSASEAHAFWLERWYQLRLLFGKNQRVAVKIVQTGEPQTYLPRRITR